MLDRTLLVRAKGGVLAITSDDEADRRRHALQMGRLKTLERMGLANEKQWLAWKDLGRFRDDGGFELRTSAFARLRAREVQRVGLEAAARLRANFLAATAGERVQGRVGETIQASGGKIVIIERRDGVSAVPWSRGLENFCGREVSGIVGACGMVIDRMRGLQR